VSRKILHPEVLARWIRHTERYEGRIPWMYLDIRGLVTIGAGVLVDPLELALRLPLQLDGRPATPGEIATEWRALKKRHSLAQQGAGAASKITRLRLTEADLDALTWSRLDSTVAALVRRWPGLPGWPWQAQLAVCSWAWAVGALAQGWPRFEAALRAQDWATAAAECRIREAGNPGVAPRNAENRRLFLEVAESQIRKGN
jgi:GH24 family phage-related lysozyme (muramidase)